MRPPSSAYSAVSVASTSASSGPAGGAPARLRSMASAPASSPATGPTFPDGETLPPLALRLSNTKANGAHHQEDEAYTLEPSNRQAVSSLPSTSSAAGSPARISRSPGAVQVSLAFALASSSSSSAWLASYGLAGFCWRTYLDCSAPTAGETSEPSSAHWETQGTAWGGECWTVAGSESPSGAEGCSLSAVLEPRVPTRFSLSPRACSGILRRAEKRGRALPTALAEALTASAKAPDPGAPTTS